MKIRKNIFLYVLLLMMTCIILTGCSSDFKHLKRNDWSSEVKKSINDLIDTYGIDSDIYDENTYAVFDFDNTVSIFDVEEQLAVYQLQTMSFEITPDNLFDVLKTGLSDIDKKLINSEYENTSYRDWISDIESAYKKLYEAYGPFNANGLEKNKQKEIQSDPLWSEFTAKMLSLYDLIGTCESKSVSYPWITYWFTGMTEDEVYELSKRSNSYYKKVNSEKITLTTPENLETKVGSVSYTYTKGVSVTKNMIELWKAFKKNGIDIWICSASNIDVIRGAIDTFGLHDYCTGILAMTNKIEDGIYINEYDYEEGYFMYIDDEGKWQKGNMATKTQPQGEGKVTAINNTIYKMYGHGPIAGFMDSTGDFNFCTEYESLKLVVCFNNGKGLVAQVAIYQKEKLNYDLKKANENGDTLYVLQGRDENNKRTFRPSNKTIMLGEEIETDYNNELSESQLDYIYENKSSIKEIIDTYAIKTSYDDLKNEFDFEYGFLENYNGYHSYK